MVNVNEHAHAEIIKLGWAHRTQVGGLPQSHPFFGVVLLMYVFSFIFVYLFVYYLVVYLFMDLFTIFTYLRISCIFDDLRFLYMHLMC